MMAALSARRFVCPAISSITRTISPISSSARRARSGPEVASWNGLLDLAHAADGSLNRFAPLARRVTDVARGAGRLSRRAPDLVRGRRSSRPSSWPSASRRGEALGVGRDLVDRRDHLLDRGSRLLTNSESVSAIFRTSSIEADISRIDVEVSSALTERFSMLSLTSRIERSIRVTDCDALPVAATCLRRCAKGRARAPPRSARSRGSRRRRAARTG